MTVQKAIEMLEWWQEAFKEAGHEESAADMNMILKEFREMSSAEEILWVDKLSPEEEQKIREYAELARQAGEISEKIQDITNESQKNIGMDEIANPEYTSCVDCIHFKDEDVHCIIRQCVHAVAPRECFEKKKD